MSDASDSVASIASSTEGLIVAFASMDGDMVDQHFGSAQAFYVFRINADEAELIGSKDFGVEKKDGNEDKLKPKLSWLIGSDIVYCGSIGGSATRQLVTLGITPLQVKGGPDVEELIDDLQVQLNGEPEFWLANILQKKRKVSQGYDRFEEEDLESWD